MDRRVEERGAGEEHVVVGGPIADLNVGASVAENVVVVGADGDHHNEDEPPDVDEDGAVAAVANAEGHEEEEGGRGGIGQIGNALLEGERVHIIDGFTYTVATVFTLGRAVAVLDRQGPPLTFLTVALQLHPDRRIAGATPTVRVDRAAALHQFVELLGDPNGRSVGSQLTLDGFRFVSDVGLFCPDAVRRLFGDVLPNKSGIRALDIDDCEVDASLIRLLASALLLPLSSANATGPAAAARPALEALKLYKIKLDQEGLQAVAALIGHRDSPLKKLELDLRGMCPAACEHICGCLPDNTKLEELELWVDDVSGDTLDHVAHDSSSLKFLRIMSSWTPKAVQSFVKQLKTNTSLEHLLLHGRIDGADFAEAGVHVENALESFNYSLKGISLDVRWNVDTSRIDGYLERNHRIQRMIESLTPLFQAKSPLGLWPVVLEMVNGLPPLVYKLLRRGDIQAFCDILRKSHGTKKRSRRSSHESHG
jgi:hypothetical protein